MENLKVRYNNGLPELDFAEFLKQSDGFGITNERILAGAKGEDFKDAGQSMCYDQLWKNAFNFVHPSLRHYNGWTSAWYVEEFLKRVGFAFPVIRGQRTVTYNGKEFNF